MEPIDWWTTGWTRGEVVNRPVVAYHGTGRAQWRSMRQDGFLRRGPLRAANHVNPGRHLYVTISPFTAAAFAMLAPLGCAVVLRLQFEAGELMFGYEGDFETGHPELLCAHDVPVARVEAVAAALSLVDATDADAHFVPHDLAARLDDELAEDDFLDQALERYSLACCGPSA